MNCPDWEPRIALHAQGDLRAEEAAETARHLASCAPCREFADGVRQSLAMLRAAHDQPIPEAHLAAVRARVLQHVEQPRRPSFRWAWIGGLAAAAVLVVLAVHSRRVPPPQVTLALPPVPQTPVVLPAPVARPSPHKRSAPSYLSRKPRPPQKPLMVKLITDDPNVVIYWIAN